MTARVANDQGDTDVAIEMPLPRQSTYASGTKVRTSVAVNRLNGDWHESKSLTNVLSAGSRLAPRGVHITRGSGQMADDLASLKPIRPISVDVMVSGQLALHMPIPTSIS